MINEIVHVDLKPGDEDVAEKIRSAVEEFFPGYPISFSLDSDGYGIKLMINPNVSPASIPNRFREEGGDIAHEISEIVSRFIPEET